MYILVKYDITNDRILERRESRHRFQPYITKDNMFYCALDSFNGEELLGAAAKYEYQLYRARSLKYDKVSPTRRE